MPSYIYSKEDFIKFINKEVSEEEVVVFTNEVCGNLTFSEKTGIKITHQFSENTFKDKGIGHIAFNKSHPLGLIIANKKRLSDEAVKAMESK